MTVLKSERYSRCSQRISRRIQLRFSPKPVRPTLRHSQSTKVYLTDKSCSLPAGHIDTAQPPIDNFPTTLPIQRSPLTRTSNLTASLLPLSFAQQRRDIRERQEGFEMRGDPTPFAVRSQTLLPLDVAFARDDIRRRHEEFETHISPDSAPAPAMDALNHFSRVFRTGPMSPPGSLNISAPHRSHPAGSSPSSVYSQSRSWIDLSIPDDSISSADSHSFASLVAAYSSRSVTSDHFEPDEARSFPSTSSFDEESFMRIAETSLGW